MSRQSLFNDLLAALVLCSVFFVVFFQVDIAVSRLFYDGNNFPLAGVEWLRDLRKLYMWVCWIIILHVFALFCLQSRIVMQIPSWIYGFITLCAVIGPGLLVNGLMKTFLGRARPYQVEMFGGEAAFTPPLPFPVGQCEANCSLVSGEAASAFMMIFLLWLLFCQPLENRKRAAISIFIIFLPMAVLRIMVGRHFFSDVLLAGLLMGVVILGTMLWQQKLFSDFRQKPKAMLSDFVALWLYFIRLLLNVRKWGSRGVSKT